MYQISRRSVLAIISVVVVITIVATMLTLSSAITPTRAADPDIDALLNRLYSNPKAYYFSVRSIDGSVHNGSDITEIGTNFVCFSDKELNYTCLPYYTVLRIDYGNK